MVLARCEIFRQGRTGQASTVRHGYQQSASQWLWSARGHERVQSVQYSSRLREQRPIAQLAYMLQSYVLLIDSIFFFPLVSNKLISCSELDLPEYDTYDTLRQQLYTAMTAGSEYFGFA